MKTKQEERERIKRLLKTHWGVAHPNYPSKLSYLIALIDEEQKEETEYKEYGVTLKFGDVIITVGAKNEEEAREIAEARLVSDHLKNDSPCYDIEVEEVVV